MTPCVDVDTAPVNDPVVAIQIYLIRGNSM